MPCFQVSHSLAALIKVLLVTGSYPPMRCGVGDYSAALVQALMNTGKTRVAVLTGDKGAKAQPGIELIRIDGWGLRSAFRAVRAAASWKPGVVHMQFPTSGYGSGWLPWFFPLLLRLRGYSVVQTWHEIMPMGSYLFSLFLCATPGPIVVVRSKYLESSPSWYRWLLAKRRVILIPNESSIPSARLSRRERDQLHAKLAAGRERIVTYFGFANPNKGIEMLFAVANPERDRIVLLCELREGIPYHEEILRRCGRAPWNGKVTVTGYLPAREVAEVLSASDAVVLPYPEGGGEWNTSLHAATAQGVFLLTTSISAMGYDPVRNIQYCRPGDVEGLRAALDSRIGTRVEPARDMDDSWARIAEAHLRVYLQASGTT